jgi:hypothetical protein
MSSPLGGLPLGSPGNAAEDLEGPWAAWFSTVQNLLYQMSSAGATSARPTGAAQWQGMPYFDTTLGKPVWLKTPGSSPVWVDATGSPA